MQDSPRPAAGITWASCRRGQACRLARARRRAGPSRSSFTSPRSRPCCGCHFALCMEVGLPDRTEDLGHVGGARAARAWPAFSEQLAPAADRARPRRSWRQQGPPRPDHLRSCRSAIAPSARGTYSCYGATLSPLALAPQTQACQPAAAYGASSRSSNSRRTSSHGQRRGAASHQTLGACSRHAPDPLPSLPPSAAGRAVCRRTHALRTPAARGGRVSLSPVWRSTMRALGWYATMA
jgi:hypothetical protein